MTEKRYLKWEELDNVTWDNMEYLWEDVAILIEVQNLIKGGGGGYGEYVKGNPWKQLNKDIGKEKTKRIIRLYCKYKNIEYDESVEVNDNINVTASDFEIFINESIREKISIKVNI